MKRMAFMVILIGFVEMSTTSGQVYVAPTGDDTNPGTMDQPLKTIAAGMTAIGSSGGLIYLREGIYQFSTTLKPDKSGLATSYNKLWAYPGEKVILDFSGQTYSSSSRGISLSRQYWHLKGLEIMNAGDNGIHISGNYNIVENCVIHHCKDTGLQISNGGSYNIIINCDSYLNYDSASHGENADGFAPKLEIGLGNEFHGCRAWLNSDDGWDLYEGAATVLIDSCWAFRNGYNLWGDSNFAGDGNEFKFGGSYVLGAHIATHCLAFDNVAKGFDQNHNTAGITIYNCTAWRNGSDFVLAEQPDSGQHILKNNLSFNGYNSIVATAEVANNSWSGFSVSADDFLSLDTASARQSRQADGSLPETDFLRLKETSVFVDAGIAVGLAFYGDAPDIGAFEWNGSAAIERPTTLPEKVTLAPNYPNPFNPVTTIMFTLNAEMPVKLTVYNVAGQVVKMLVNERCSLGEYSVRFDGDRLASGIYFYRLMAGDRVLVRKMVLMH